MSSDITCPVCGEPRALPAGPIASASPCACCSAAADDPAQRSGQPVPTFRRAGARKPLLPARLARRLTLQNVALLVLGAGVVLRFVVASPPTEPTEPPQPIAQAATVPTEIEPPLPEPTTPAPVAALPVPAVVPSVDIEAAPTSIALKSSPQLVQRLLPPAKADVRPAPPALPDVRPELPMVQAGRLTPSATFKRRNHRDEDDLRRELARAPEVGLGTSGPAIFQSYIAATETNTVVIGDPNWTDPTPMLQVRPDLRHLPVRGGPVTKLTGREANTLDLQSRKLRTYLTANAPVGADGRRPAAVLLGEKMRAEARVGRPEWLRAEAIPALMQLLMHEDPPVRRLLVELLAEIPGAAAARALAQRAVFDLNAGNREAAVHALRERSPLDYRPVFVKALRYPWAPAADYASEALVALGDKDAVPELITLLRRHDPCIPKVLPGNTLVVQEVVRAKHLTNCLLCHPPSMTGSESSSLGVDPVLSMAFPTSMLQAASVSGGSSGGSGSSFDLVTQSVTRLTTTPGCHHYENFTTTSGGSVVVVQQAPPSFGPQSKFTRFITKLAVVPKPTAPPRPGQPRTLRSGGTDLTMLPLVIRGDITYLRQDFSVQQPAIEAPPDGPPVPRARFDYVVRTREANAPERRAHKAGIRPTTYPQREAVLFALRELTGQDAGATTESWQDLFPQADADVLAARLSRDLLKADEVRQGVLLAKLHEGKGLGYTLALAQAIPGLTGEAQEKAREALADRLTRMTVATLRDKLQDDDPEVRRGAVQACARKGEKELVPDLIALLDGGEPWTAHLAETGLKTMTGREHVTPAAWRTWWEGQKQGEPASGKPTEKSKTSGS